MLTVQVHAEVVLHLCILDNDQGSLRWQICDGNAVSNSTVLGVCFQITNSVTSTIAVSLIGLLDFCLHVRQSHFRSQPQQAGQC